ncbi:MAG: DUF2007 domain-containing protein [Prevotella sp.]|jgi:hypothetical protein|nr:DUF2007 domain-containing protein [Prevotella sp.]
MDKLVTVRTFTHPSEMYVIRWRLEMEGIECYAKDELTVQVNPFYSNALGGVKLQVRESDLEKAAAVLKESESCTDINAESVTGAELRQKAGAGGEVSRCPFCGSAEIAARKYPGYIYVFSFLLLGFPLPFLKKAYHCFDCGLNFR